MATVRESERVLADVPVEVVFWVHDGRILKNLKELQEALTSMTEETFGFHVTAEKNDFANWVRDVIKDERLARDLSRTRSRTLAAKRVAERLPLLKSGRS